MKTIKIFLVIIAFALSGCYTSEKVYDDIYGNQYFKSGDSGKEFNHQGCNDIPY